MAASLLSSLLLGIVVLITSIFALVLLYYKYAFGYWRRKNVPYITPTFPYGNLKALIKHEQNFPNFISDIYFEAKRRSVPFIGIYLLAKPQLVLCDVTLIKSIMTENFRTFPGRGFYCNEEIDPLSGNILHFTGPKWKEIRIKISPMFSTAKLKLISTWFGVTSKEIEKELEEHVSKSLPIDIRDLAEKAIMNNTGRTFFGIECDTFGSNRELLLKSKHAVEDYSNPLPFCAPDLMTKLRMPFYSQETTKYFLGLFKETFEARKKSGIERKDIVDVFIKLEKDENMNEMNGSGLTTECMAAQAFMFMVAGWETSATAITFSMLNLTEYIDIQDKVRNEIIQVLKKYNNELCYDAVMEMKYLECVINETLRMYPPIANILRQTCEKFHIPGTDIVLDPGTTVWVPVMGIHRDPEIYPDPDKFDPDRELNLPTYLPFGNGPRNCIGMRSGLLQVKFALVALLKNHRYTIQNKKLNKELSPYGFDISLKEKLMLNVEKLDTIY